MLRESLLKLGELWRETAQKTRHVMLLPIQHTVSEIGAKLSNAWRTIRKAYQYGKKALRKTYTSTTQNVITFYNRLSLYYADYYRKLKKSIENEFFFSTNPGGYQIVDKTQIESRYRNSSGRNKYINGGPTMAQMSTERKTQNDNGRSDSRQRKRHFENFTGITSHSSNRRVIISSQNRMMAKPSHKVNKDLTTFDLQKKLHGDNNFGGNRNIHTAEAVVNNVAKSETSRQSVFGSHDRPDNNKKPVRVRLPAKTNDVTAPKADQSQLRPSLTIPVNGVIVYGRPYTVEQDIVALRPIGNHEYLAYDKLGNPVAYVRPKVTPTDAQYDTYKSVRPTPDRIQPGDGRHGNLVYDDGQITGVWVPVVIRRCEDLLCVLRSVKTPTDDENDIQRTNIKKNIDPKFSQTYILLPVKKNAKDLSDWQVPKPISSKYINGQIARYERRKRFSN